VTRAHAIGQGRRSLGSNIRSGNGRTLEIALPGALTSVYLYEACRCVAQHEDEYDDYHDERDVLLVPALQSSSPSSSCCPAAAAGPRPVSAGGGTVMWSVSGQLVLGQQTASTDRHRRTLPLYLRTTHRRIGTKSSDKLPVLDHFRFRFAAHAHYLKVDRKKN